MVSGMENSCALRCDSGDVEFGWVSLSESGVFRRSGPFRGRFSRKESVVRQAVRLARSAQLHQRRPEGTRRELHVSRSFQPHSGGVQETVEKLTPALLVFICCFDAGSVTQRLTSLRLLRFGAAPGVNLRQPLRPHLFSAFILAFGSTALFFIANQPTKLRLALVIR